ncbi:MAG TPA: hypothetical protein VLA95_11700 [Gemmatimonadales bacterium]|nr:hypothetical protein [Gemmatimonadales bacterium]
MFPLVGRARLRLGFEDGLFRAELDADGFEPTDLRGPARHHAQTLAFPSAVLRAGLVA